MILSYTGSIATADCSYSYVYIYYDTSALRVYVYTIIELVCIM